MAGSLAIGLILSKLKQRHLSGYLLIGPLGLLTVYGLVGAVASGLSPDMSVSLYWAAVYLAVPLVLWAVTWGSDSLDLIYRVVSFNWFVITIVVVGLFAIALLYLDLGSIALTPRSWFRCELNNPYHGEAWLFITGGVLRPTGVGRYAAIAAIVALGGLWRGGLRLSWGLILIASLSLLFTSGARSAYLGFAVAAPLVLVLHYGKKVAVATALGAIVLAAVVWQAGFHEDFLSYCARVTSTTSVEIATEQQPLEGKAAASAVPVSSLVSSVEPKQSLPSKPGASVQPTGAAGPDQLASQPTDASGAAGPDQLASQPNINPGASDPPTDASGIAGPDQLASQPIINPVASLPPTDTSGIAGPDQLASQPIINPVASLPPTDTSGIAEQDQPSFRGITFSKSFSSLSGRTYVWKAGWEAFKESPALGFGFHADRLLFGTHLHNAVLHALVQTGLIGTIPFVAGLTLGWVFLFNVLINRARLPYVYQHLAIQSGGILAFLSVRMLTESTGAFFGVDWLILAPLLLYLQIAHRVLQRREVQSERLP